jgi:hypothetical protein
MSTLTGTTPRNTYKDLLQVSNSNSGIDGTYRDLEDGEGTAAGVQVSTNGLNVPSGKSIIFASGSSLTADTIAETTSATGVTVDSVLLKDGLVLTSAGLASGVAVGVGYAGDGFWSIASGQIGVAVGGTNKWRITGNDFRSENASGPTLINEAVTGTNPTLSPRVGDYDTGIGSSAANQLSLITAGAQGVGISSAGEVTKPLTPAFLATRSSAANNVTGNGTTYTVDFNNEVFDQNADFSSTTFTAPVTGRYRLTAGALAYGFTEANITAARIDLVTSNRTYRWSAKNAWANEMPFSISVLADMDAADTATVQITMSGEASDLADIDGQATSNTFFCGELVA